MEKSEVLHLARLARIRLSDEEVEQFTKEIGPILEYVSQLDEVIAESGLTKTVGPVHNVFRDDAVTIPSGEYSEALQAEMPETSGAYLKVKKILNPDN